jgi:hypothetical protein
VEESSLARLVALIEDGGLDFGVLAVWVCPASCEGGGREVGVVQAPPDIHSLKSA